MNAHPPTDPPPDLALLQVGELARLTGVSTRMLRYYEEQGLLRPARQPNGYRVYPQEATSVVEQIRSMRAFNCPTAAIRRSLTPHQPEEEIT